MDYLGRGFYDNWRVQRTIIWASFAGSSAVIGLLYLISILILKSAGQGKAGDWIFFGVVAALASLAAGCVAASIWKVKITEKYPLFFKKNTDRLVYVIPKGANPEKTMFGETIWKVLPNKVTFGQLKTELESFDKGGDYLLRVYPFAGQGCDFEISADLHYRLADEVTPGALLIYYENDQGIRDYVSESGTKALFEAALKVFFFKDGKPFLKEQSFVGSIENMLKMYFHQAWAEKIVKNGQRHISGYIAEMTVSEKW
jgi:hypothetical protein